MTPGSHTILVMGAAGFIGSAVAARLAALGHRVTGCDNFNGYYDPKLKSGRVKALLEACDVQCPALELADAVQVKALCERVRPPRCRSAPTAPTRQCRCTGDKKSQRADGLFVQPPVPVAGHRPALRYRLRAMGAAGHGLFQASPKSCSEVKRFPYSPQGCCGATSPASTILSKGGVCCSSRFPAK